jgi:hypothetical protein
MFLSRVGSALGVEDGPVALTQPGAEISAVLMGKVVGKGLGYLEALDPWPAEEVVDDPRLILEQRGDLLSSVRSPAHPTGRR